MKIHIWVFKKNLSRKIRASIKSDQNNSHVTLRCTYISWSLVQFFLEWEMFHIKVVEKIKTYILCSVNVFLKSRRLRDNVKKLGTAGRATNIHFWSYFSEFYLEREMFQTKVVEKIKTHILCSVTLVFFENPAVYETMWGKKCCTARRATAWQYGTCALHAGQLRIQHTQNTCHSFVQGHQR